MRKVPELRFDGFDWEWEENKFSKNFDTTIPKNSLSRNMLTNQVTKVKNIHYGDIHKFFDNILQSSNEKIPYIINDDLSTHERYFLQDGDIIFTDAAEDNTAGKCVELDIDDGSNIVAGLHTIPARPIKFGKFFYGFYLNSNSFHNKIIPLLEGTKVSSISKTNLNTLSVIVPKVQEQEKIGDLFKKLDDLIEIQEGKFAKLEDFKKSMLQKMFPKKGELVPEFRFDGFDEKWNLFKLNELQNMRVYQPQTITSEDLIDGGKFRVFGANDYIGYYNDYNHENSQVTICCRGASVGNVNYVEPYTWITGNSMVLNVDENDKINKNYLYYYLKNIRLDRFITGSGQPQITREGLSLLKIKLTDLEEQAKIGQFFKNLDTQIENEERLLESYKIMKKSLLQKMFV